jgi:hypothetical protein
MPPGAVPEARRTLLVGLGALLVHPALDFDRLVEEQHRRDQPDLIPRLQVGGLIDLDGEEPYRAGVLLGQ